MVSAVFQAKWVIFGGTIHQGPSGLPPGRQSILASARALGGVLVWESIMASGTYRDTPNQLAFGFPALNRVPPWDRTGTTKNFGDIVETSLPS